MKEETNEIIQKINSNSILFFDLDGTLIETDYANYLSYKDAIKKIKDIEITFNQNKRFDRSCLFQAIPNLSNLDAELIIKLKEENYPENLSFTKLNSIPFEILKKYCKTNTTVLVTNCRKERAKITLEHHNVLDCFAHVFYGTFRDEKKINKFQTTIENLNISPKSVIVFENDENEIIDAISVGIPKENTISL